MTTYLAIDFGTTNCVAAEVTTDLKLELVPLEGERAEMPSAIFLRRRFAGINKLNDMEYERRVGRAIAHEIEVHKRALESIEKRLNDFYSIYKPRIFDPKRVYSSYERRHLKFVDSAVYQRALQDFEGHEMVLERARLEAHIVNPRTELEIREEIRAQMLSENMEFNVQLLKEETFFTALNDPETVPVIGQAAVKEYTENPMSGFFMRSPKAFLAANLTAGQSELFTKAVFLIVSHIKRESEIYFNKSFDGVVIGRPVNFMGANSDIQNRRAIDILRTAAVRSGFKFVRFVQEPLAAALVIPQSIYSSAEPALIVDVGGGTTDVAYLNVSTGRDAALKVDGLAGERTGGNDFDQSIALKKFGPYIGRDVPTLNSFVVDALSTRDIHAQAKFRLAGAQLYQLVKTSPNDLLCKRLYHLYAGQLQHRVLMSSESLKISLSTNNETTMRIEFLAPEFELKLTMEEVISVCESHMNTIRRNIIQATPPEKLNTPVRVYMTGGMSGFLPVANLIRNSVPKGSSIRRISALYSIVAGLAVVSRQLSLSEGFVDEPTSVRGIPVHR
jgi:hypothetical chaperone protein